LRPSIIHFLSLFAALLAIINPLEAIPVFLRLLQGKDEKEHRRVARKSCFYALLMMVFFLLFGTFLLKVFGVSLSMIRIVGGIILTRIGFELFAPSPSAGIISVGANGAEGQQSVSFVPLAMPIVSPVNTATNKQSSTHPCPQCPPQTVISDSSLNHVIRLRYANHSTDHFRGIRSLGDARSIGPR